MNKCTTSFLLSAATMLLVTCGGVETYDVRLQRHWPAAAVQRVSIREVDGSVQIAAVGSGRDITLEAHVRSRGIRPRPAAENEGFFRSSVDGNTLTIEGRESKHHFRFPFFQREQLSIDYVLNVPASMALDIRSVNGSIASDGVDGRSELITVNGPIDIVTSGLNELVARTVNGEVHATFSRAFQGATLKTVNGGIHASLPPTASFACDLSQVNGDFEANFPLSIHSNPGSRRASGQINGGSYALKIVTVNGDVRIDNGSPSAPLAPAVPADVPPPVPPPSAPGEGPDPHAPPVPPAPPARP